jgi:hypothetical protein
LITGLAGLSVSMALSGLALSISGSRQSMLVVHVGHRIMSVLHH